MGQGRGKRGRRTRTSSLDSDLVRLVPRAKLSLSTATKNLKYGIVLHVQKTGRRISVISTSMVDEQEQVFKHKN